MPSSAHFVSSYFSSVYLTTAVDLSFHISNVTAAKQFAQALTRYASESTVATSQAQGASKKDTSEKQKWASSQTTKANDPYLILQVPYSASEEEIAAAYRKMAQMYHPDKVATMAPEFKELAETRMKELNSAYDQLKLKFK
jgi:DnaJ-domain-containing protein 1